MEINLPPAGDDCKGISISDFDTHKIPSPPQGANEEKDKTILLFKDSEEALSMPFISMMFLSVWKLLQNIIVREKRSDR